MAAEEEFARDADPFRRELLAHCYRMLGSVHDAEDLVQETFLRAWRAYDRFDDRRASMRTWLYRIATNACLTALEQRERRPLPSSLVGATDDPRRPLDVRSEIPWLEPIPDALVAGARDDPASVVAFRGSVRLALIAALQHLPARQRAVLIMRDVLGWTAAETAQLLETSVAAVNSALQRARAQLHEVAPAEDEVTEPGDPRWREALDRYVAAFAEADVDAVVRLLRDDVVVEMPPALTWFAGRAAFGQFLASRDWTPDLWRAVATQANGQPAVATYRRGDDGGHHAHSVHVLTVTTGGIAHVVAFQHPQLFAAFDLPPTR